MAASLPDSSQDSEVTDRRDEKMSSNQVAMTKINSAVQLKWVRVHAHRLLKRTRTVLLPLEKSKEEQEDEVLVLVLVRQ